MEKILKILEKEILEDISQIQIYAGIAFLDDDEPEMKFWKGQYIALKRVLKNLEKYNEL